MARLGAPEDWTDLDDEPQSATNPGWPGNPSMNGWEQTADAAKHISVYNHRLIFCQHIPLSSAPTSAVDPLYRYRYDQSNPHGETQVLAGIVGPANFAATGDMKFGISPSGPYAWSSGRNNSPAEPGDLSTTETMLTETVADGYVTKDVEIDGGLRMCCMVVYERAGGDTNPLDTLNTTEDIFKGRSTKIYGAAASASSIDNLTKHIEDIYLYQRKVRAWSAVGSTYRTYNVNVYRNIMDISISARSATSPGVLVREAFATRLAKTAPNAKVRCAAYCLTTGAGSTGQIKFESSKGNVVIQAPITTAAWVQASTLLDVDSTEARGTGRASDKVDIFAQAPASEAVRIWAYTIQTEADWT